MRSTTVAAHDGACAAGRDVHIARDSVTVETVQIAITLPAELAGSIEALLRLGLAALGIDLADVARPALRAPRPRRPRKRRTRA